jgi:hypothetical protein
MFDILSLALGFGFIVGWPNTVSTGGGGPDREGRVFSSPSKYLTSQAEAALQTQTLMELVQPNLPPPFPQTQLRGWLGSGGGGITAQG